MTALHDLSLAEALDGLDDDEIVAPESREHVDRLLGRLARVRAARARDTHDAEVRRAQVDAWLDARCAIHDNQTTHIEQVLAAWHTAVLEIDPKAKSVSLPGGTLKSRSYGPTVKVTDEAVFVAWATDAAPMLVRTKTVRSADRTAIKDALAVTGDSVVDPTTGEAVPGVTGIPAGRTFSVVLNTEDGPDE